MLIVCGSFQEGLEPREIQASVATGETEILLKNAEGKLAPDNNKHNFISPFPFGICGGEVLMREGEKAPKM